jgi:phosphate starvation-inducible PhoH-like protein
VRGDALVLRGEPAETETMSRVVCRLVELLEREKALDTVSVHYVLEQHLRPQDGEPEALGETLLMAGNRRAIRVKTAGQQGYVEAIRAHDVVFAIGPAGTGKTYLARGLAMDYLKRGLVERIILVRPAVEAGERLGFLPGDLQEKIDPYLRPLHDALGDTVGPVRIQRYMSSGVIEAAPLAYMRGRTLNHAFIILDEAQNTTLGQMKMFLTRLGHQSRPSSRATSRRSTWRRARTPALRVHILAGTEGISFVELTQQDVVRHRWCGRIVEAFREAEERGAEKRK